MPIPFGLSGNTQQTGWGFVGMSLCLKLSPVICRIQLAGMLAVRVPVAVAVPGADASDHGCLSGLLAGSFVFHAIWAVTAVCVSLLSHLAWFSITPHIILPPFGCGCLSACGIVSLFKQLSLLPLTYRSSLCRWANPTSVVLQIGTMLADMTKWAPEHILARKHTRLDQLKWLVHNAG